MGLGISTASLLSLVRHRQFISTAVVLCINSKHSTFGLPVLGQLRDDELVPDSCASS
jgi:hypothetical protein